MVSTGDAMSPLFDDEARQHVVAFLQRHAKDADEAVVDYVCGWMCVEEDVEPPTPEDVLEILVGCCPDAFPSTSQEDRIRAIQDVMDDVRRTQDTRRKEEERKRTNGETVADVMDACLRRNQMERDEERASMETLRALFEGEAKMEDVKHVVKHVCGGDYDRAAEWILETPNSAQVASRLRSTHEEEQRAMRQEIVSRYAHTSDSSRSKRPPEPLRVNADVQNTRVRWRDGVVVSMRGEKVIYEKVKEEWDGGSRGRVKLKGKRGKGWA